MNQQKHPLHKTIYRFNFSDEIIEEITNFSTLHMYTDRKTFKEKWIEWTETNEEQLQNEHKRLTNLGYTGNFNDKIFKATRYYFKQKQTLGSCPHTTKDNTDPHMTKYNTDPNTTKDNTDPHMTKDNTDPHTTTPSPAPTTSKREYIQLDYELIQLMDSHIKETYTKAFKPSTAYNNFVLLYKDQINREIATEKSAKEKYSNKLKKSYKNRCYNYIKSIK